jgi:hypothetical protein
MPAALLLIGLLISKNDENFQLFGGCSTPDAPRVEPPLYLLISVFRLYPTGVTNCFYTAIAYTRKKDKRFNGNY